MEDLSAFKVSTLAFTHTHGHISNITFFRFSFGMTVLLVWSAMILVWVLMVSEARWKHGQYSEALLDADFVNERRYLAQD